MSEKILITVWENNVAPRFDLTTEVLIAQLDDEWKIVEFILVDYHSILINGNTVG